MYFVQKILPKCCCVLLWCTITMNKQFVLSGPVPLPSHTFKRHVPFTTVVQQSCQENDRKYMTELSFHYWNLRFKCSKTITVRDRDSAKSKVLNNLFKIFMLSSVYSCDSAGQTNLLIKVTVDAVAVCSRGKCFNVFVFSRGQVKRTVAVISGAALVSCFHYKVTASDALQFVPL